MGPWASASPDTNFGAETRWILRSSRATVNAPGAKLWLDAPWIGPEICALISGLNASVRAAGNTESPEPGGSDYRRRMVRFWLFPYVPSFLLGSLQKCPGN